MEGSPGRGGRRGEHVRQAAVSGGWRAGARIVEGEEPAGGTGVFGAGRARECWQETRCLGTRWRSATAEEGVGKAEARYGRRAGR